MALWCLLRRDALRDIQLLLLAVAMVGALNLAVMTSINDALLHLDDGDVLQRLLITFLVCSLLWRVVQKWTMGLASKRIQTALGALRLDLLRRALAAELPDVMTVGSARISQAVGPELQLLAQAVPTLVISVQSVMAIGLCLFYMSWLSGLAVLIMTGCLLIGGVLVGRLVVRMEHQAEELHEVESGLSERTEHIMKTLRECKVNRRRHTDALADVAASTRDLNGRRHRFNVLYSDYFVSSELTYYFALAGVVFLLPALAATPVETVVLAAHAAAFIAYPVITIVTTYPSYLAAETAARTYLAVEEGLKMPVLPPQAAPGGDFSGFSTIALAGMTFRHAGQDGVGSFTVGPIDLTVERGTVVFVTGHNGSGKSTLMHMLLGLYPAQRGGLSVDGAPVAPDAMTSYRDLFSVVFSDGHLTRQLYGARALDDGFAEELLDLLEIADKVALDGRAFTTVDLSQGQKKRLSLIAALLERKPVLVLDEWAADQSPYFRRKFYREIIPWLKARGITVIAVTHDDAYFDAADVQIQVDRGSARRLAPPVPTAPLPSPAAGGASEFLPTA